ncbi:MAG: gamma-glutamyl-gamma-aminobutyrate hydrolase family protein [Tissierellia bacterium]|nr:gamma-glutamyl-gamma-aminobutyrate hydrolase family protein [Tissierellia bacterium]
MRKPIIGISGSILEDNGGYFPGYKKSYVSEYFVESVSSNGAVPIILPITTDIDIIKKQISLIDGLILTGGHDVSPLFYNEEPKLKLGRTLYDRDFFELNLLKFSIEKDIPILGICRGMQLMNVYFGGSLYQDTSYQKDFYIKHNQVYDPPVPTHSVDIIKGTKIYDIFKKDSLLVNSFHHQMINKLADPFIKSSSSKDGCIESIEHKDKDFLIGVQWHPEMLHKSTPIMNNIFKKLIEKSL